VTTPDMTRHQVIVVGAGAAGLMAAGQAAEQGAETLLFEKMDRPGRKLRIAGKGRCNLTNITPLPEFIAHFGPNGRFLRQAFHRFFTPELLTFFKAQGIPTVTERGGRVFPASGQARDVVDALMRWVGQNEVTLRTRSPVERLLVEGEQVTGVQLSHIPSLLDQPPARQVYRADAVIVATGGASYPATGSTGDGYRLARSVGHTIVPIRPALVPLETAGEVAPRLQGLSLRNVTARLWVDGKKEVEAFGEMLFTHFGISGPIILSLSKQAVDALRLGRSVSSPRPRRARQATISHPAQRVAPQKTDPGLHRSDGHSPRQGKPPDHSPRAPAAWQVAEGFSPKSDAPSPFCRGDRHRRRHRYQRSRPAHDGFTPGKGPLLCRRSARHRRRHGGLQPASSVFNRLDRRSIRSPPPSWLKRPAPELVNPGSLEGDLSCPVTRFRV